jgi:hypothetical protein
MHPLVFFILPALAGTAEPTGVLDKQSPIDRRIEQQVERRDLLGAHDITGTISAISYDTGRLKLRTEVGELDLYFRPRDVSELARGDTITVYLAFTREEDLER